MNRQKFERMTLAEQFKPLKRVHTRHGDVLLAERYRNLDPKMMEPHWQVVWAIDRDGLDMGRILYCRFGSLQKDRIAAAVQDAETFMKDCVEAARYE